MMVAVPPAANIPKACSLVAFRPSASNEYSTPPRVSSCTWPTGSPAVASTVSVAPNVRARSSFSAATSTAITCAAPATTAPCTTFRPMPPQPMTATVAPGGTFAVLNTAPRPVVTAQPTSAATSTGTLSSIFNSACSGRSICSANPPTPANWSTGDAVLGQRRAEAGGAGGPVLAHVRTTGRARRAQSARRRRARDHLVARTEVGDVGTDGLDDARRLVSQHRRHADRQRALDAVQVAVAQTRGVRVHQHFVGADRSHFEIGDVEPTRALVKDCCAHRGPP